MRTSIYKNIFGVVFKNHVKAMPDMVLHGL